MKKIKLLSFIFISFSLSFSFYLGGNLFVSANDYGLKNPRVSENVTTWDCVYFGKYYQNSDSVKEPIKWRVLEVNDNDAFLLSDQALDYKHYNEDYEHWTWDVSTLRAWLNSDFYNTAFDVAEKSSIKKSYIKNANHPKTENEGGSDTYDKIFLLSYDEAIEPKYGINPATKSFTNSKRPGCKATRYAQLNGCSVVKNNGSPFDGNCYWWLRSPGFGAGNAVRLRDDGSICDGIIGDDYGSGVRPALHLNLSSNTWSKGGIVKISEDESSNYNTSFNSVLGYDDFKAFFESIKEYTTDYSDIINQKKNIIIPGLEQTNQSYNGKLSACSNMVPQGVCVTDEYILISAYDKSKHSGHSSVIYVMDKENGEYLKTLILRDKGHAGALAWNGKGTVYIAGEGNRVYMIKTSEIVSSDDEDAVAIPVSEILVPQHPSYLAFSGGYLYVGNMGNTKSGSNVTMAKCNSSGKQVDMLKFSMPNKTQGVAFAQGIDGKNYLVASMSLGRKKGSTAELKCYPLSFKSYLMKYQKATKTVNVPYMNEDVDINNGLLYTCFESAANNYRFGLDGNGNGAKPQSDRILVSYAQKIIGATLKSKSTKSGAGDDGVELLKSGECGEQSNYSLYDDGSLIVSGFGNINDYSSSTNAPWSDYSNQIKNVVIGADITCVGKNAFSNLTNLEEVTFSDMLNDQETFTINDYAFKNCANLEIVNMPNVSFNISSTAFDGCNKLQIRSDSESVTDYCDSKSIDIHNHNFKYKSTVAPNCLDDGYDIYECDCGEEDLRNIKQATDNHSYKVTDSYGNIKVYTCEKCGSQYEEEIENTPNKKSNTNNKKIVNNKPTSIKKIKAKKKSLKLSWKKVSGVNGYQINYSLKKNFKKSKTITIKKALTSSKTIKKLKKKKKYYLRMRTYILNSNKKIFSKWSKVKSKKTK